MTIKVRAAVDDSAPLKSSQKHAAKVTLAQVVASYDAQKAQRERHGEWAAAFFYRPLSFLLTPLCARLGLTPSMISCLVFLAALAPLWLVFDLREQAYLWVGIIGIGIGILDCLDGNLARVLNAASAQGAYLDFLADILVRLSLYLCTGLMIDLGPERAEIFSGWASVVALLGVIFALMARLCRLYTQAADGGGDPYAGSDERKIARGFLMRYLFPALSGFDSAVPIIILIAGFYNCLSYALVWFVALSFSDFIYTQISLKGRFT